MDRWYSIAGFNDPMSSLSHLAGTVVFVLLSIHLLAVASESRMRLASAIVFCFSAVFMLTMSFLFHMFGPGFTTRAVMLRLDVAAIFLLIAGTFTPIHMILFCGWKRWGILIPIWTVALAGITLRTIFFDRIPFTVGIGIFLAMGWIGAISAWYLYHDYDWKIVSPIITGGVLYSVGALFSASNVVVIPMVWGGHETFHLFVLAALGVHWSVISKIVRGDFGERKNRF